MRKVILNKWFLIAAVLTISLSTLSFAAYKNVRAVCAAPAKCPNTVEPQGGGMLWDVLSRPFVSVVSRN